MPTIQSKNSGDTLTPEQVAERGQRLYEEKLKANLEPTEKGQFVAIEVESGEYFIADTLLEVLQMAKEKHPTKLFHTIRIGYGGVFKMGSYTGKRILYGWGVAR